MAAPSPPAHAVVPPPSRRGFTVASSLPARRPADVGASADERMQPLAPITWAGGVGTRQLWRLCLDLLGEAASNFPPDLRHPDVLPYLMAEWLWQRHQQGEEQLTQQALAAVQARRSAAVAELPPLLAAAKRIRDEATAFTRQLVAAGMIRPPLEFRPAANGLLNLLGMAQELRAAQASTERLLHSVPGVLPPEYARALLMLALGTAPRLLSALEALDAADQQYGQDWEELQYRRTAIGNTTADWLQEQLWPYLQALQAALPLLDGQEHHRWEQQERQPFFAPLCALDQVWSGFCGGMRMGTHLPMGGARGGGADAAPP